MALTAVVAGGVFAAYTLYFSKTGGAQTPESAVTEFAQAINDEDLVGAALLLPPNELQSIRDSFVSAGEAAVRTDFAQGSPELSSVLAGADVTIAGLRVTAELVEPDLAKVTLQSGTFAASIDPSQTSGITRELVDSSTVDWVTAGRVSIDVQTITDKLGRKPYVMVVNRDGGWYVSPMFTAGEYLSDYTGAPRAPSSLGDGQSTVYDSPEAAAEGFVRALADVVNTGESASLAEGLPPDEALAVLTYRRSLDELLQRTPGVTVELREVSFTTLGDSGDARLVHPELISFDGYAQGNTGQIEIQDQCVIVNNEVDKFCLNEGYLPGRFYPLLTNLTVDLVAVRSGEGWRISPLATIAAAVKQVADGLSPTQALSQIDNLIQSEASAAKLFSVPTSATIGLGESVEMQFEPSELYQVVELKVDSFAGIGQTVDDPGFCAGSFTMTPLSVTRNFSGLELEPGVYKIMVFPYVWDESSSSGAERVSSCTFQVNSS